MSDASEHFERLLSERPDGIADADDQAESNRIIADNPGAAESALRYERLHRLLTGWRPMRHEVDWDAFKLEVSARVSEASEQDASAALDARIDPTALIDPTAGEATAEQTGPRLHKVAKEYEAVEELVEDWAGSVPEVDWAGFKNRVSQAVREEAESLGRDAILDSALEIQQDSARRRWRKLSTRLVSIGAPLAAAAAIALFVLWPRGNSLTAPTPGGGAPQIVLVSLDMPGAAGRISIAFDEAPTVMEEKAPEGGVAMAVTPRNNDRIDTIDAAFYY